MKFIFCFPYRGAGGVNNMFTRLASYLHSRNYHVSLIDYIDGAMAINKDKNIELIPYYDDQVLLVPEKSILVFQSMTPWSIYPSLKIKEDTKLLFISTLPVNFYPLLPGLRNVMSEGGLVAKLVWSSLLYNEYSKMRKFLALIEKKNGHMVLDADIVCNIRNSLNIKITDPKFLPLFSSNTSENCYMLENKNSNEILNLLWVGRIADFKINILNHVISDAFKYANKFQMKIEFTIVGEGNYESKLYKQCSEYFKIVRIENVKASELDSFMLKYDILFAMGTTALDGARIGMPTVRLDYSYKSIPKGYKYKFFYEIQGYSMGERIESNCFKKGIHDFEGLINTYISGRRELSMKCFEFYNKNHSISKSANIFIDNAEKTSLRWGDIKNQKLNKSFLYSLLKRLR